MLISKEEVTMLLRLTLPFPRNFNSANIWRGGPVKGGIAAICPFALVVFVHSRRQQRRVAARVEPVRELAADDHHSRSFSAGKGSTRPYTSTEAHCE